MIHSATTLTVEQVIGNLRAQKPDLCQEQPWAAPQLPTRTTVDL